MKKVIIRKTDTQNKLIKALSKLLLKKDIQSISTTEICKLAKMNRSTFYANYYDQFDLYNDLKNELLNKCNSSLSNAFNDGKSIKKFLLLIKTDKLIQVLLQKETDASFVNDIKNYEKQQMHQNISYLFINKDSEYIYDFLIDGSFAIIVRWIRNECDRTVDEIYNLITNIISNINFFFELNNKSTD